MKSAVKSLTIRQFTSQQPYQTIWEAMREFTDQRTAITADEIWLLEHQPVFTLGQKTDLSHLLNHSEIPVVQSDRGGQITYHGPGQLMAYVLLDLRRNQLNVRSLVTLLEQSMIALIGQFNHQAYAKKDAPGVYIDSAKIGSVGLRVRRGCSYHGLSLNVNMDLRPFSQINPCGYKNLAMTQLADLVDNHISVTSIVPAFCAIITDKLNYDQYQLLN
ncbi:MAG: lipoyl(octanoyl) transferase LipB [Pseudomonadota bacterium]